MISGERVRLRPLAESDVPRLAEIGSEPEVARWWPDIDEPELLEKARGEEEDVTALAVELDGEVVGLVQFGEETDPEYRHASIDLFLSTSVHGRGLGTDTVRTLARYLFRERGHHRVTIDPAVANERAVRCYERVGFKRVGVMRRYERGADGHWHDGLLMDLLAEELDHESLTE